MNMNNIGSVKEEYLGSSSISEDVGKGYCSSNNTQPMGGLNETGPPPFLSKTYDFVEDESTNEIVSWSRGNNSFIVLDPQRFAINLLPKYFKHSNFSSFVRQLNTYGFRKVDPDRWEFANEGFLRGKRHLLKNIRRRKTSSNIPQSSSNQSGLESCVEVGRFGLDAEIDSLRRDKHVLMVELVKLRQQQQNTKAYLQEMEQRLQGTELKQKQTLSFLARAIQNPVFLQQMVQQKERRKEIQEAIGKKRRKKIDHASRSSDVYISFDGVGVEVEDLELGHFEGGDNISVEDECLELELEKVAPMSMPAEALESAEEHVAAPMKFVDEECWMHSSAENPYDQGFWEGLVNEGIDHLHGFGVEGVLDDEGHVDILTEQLGFLGSNPR